MTQYFDEIDSAIASIHAYDAFAAEQLGKIEQQLVYDVVLATTFEGFPLDLRDAIDLAIRVYGVETRPQLDLATYFITFAEHRNLIRNLSSRFHDIFHALVQRQLDGFSDSPRIPPLRAVALAQERQEDDAAALKLFRNLLIDVLLDPTVALHYGMGPPPAANWEPALFQLGAWTRYALHSMLRVVVFPLYTGGWGWRGGKGEHDYATSINGGPRSLMEMVEAANAWIQVMENIETEL